MLELQEKLPKARVVYCSATGGRSLRISGDACDDYLMFTFIPQVLLNRRTWHTCPDLESGGKELRLKNLLSLFKQWKEGKTSNLFMIFKVWLLIINWQCSSAGQ